MSQRPARQSANSRAEYGGSEGSAEASERSSRSIGRLSSIDKRHPGDRKQHADDGGTSERLAEKQKSHERRRRRHEVEHAGNSRGGAAPDQPEQQHRRADGKREAEPEKRQHELAGPDDAHVLEEERADEDDGAGARILDDGRGAEVLRPAETLLVERAEGDPDEGRDDAR